MHVRLTPTMHDVRTFFGGALLAAAALSVLGSLLIAPISAVVTAPVTVIARVGTAIEFFGSLFAGIAAVWAVHKRRD